MWFSNAARRSSVTANSLVFRSLVPRLLPLVALVTLALLAVWRAQGSIAVRDWAPYALIAALVLAVSAVSGAAATPKRAVVIAAAGLVSLGAWDAISLTWSASPSVGRDEALLPVLYAIALLIPVLTIQRLVEQIWATAAIVAGLGGLAVATAGALIAASDPASVYDVGRLAFPIQYPNAQAALFLLGAWPALALAAMRELPSVARGLAFGPPPACSAAGCSPRARAAQSGSPSPSPSSSSSPRAGSGCSSPTALVAAIVGIAFTTLTAPYDAQGDGELASIHRAGWAELLLVAVGAVAGIAYAAADRRGSVPRGRSRLAGRIALGLLIVSSQAPSSASSSTRATRELRRGEVEELQAPAGRAQLEHALRARSDRTVTTSGASRSTSSRPPGGRDRRARLRAAYLTTAAAPRRRREHTHSSSMRSARPGSSASRCSRSRSLPSSPRSPACARRTA